MVIGKLTLSEQFAETARGFGLSITQEAKTKLTDPKRACRAICNRSSQGAPIRLGQAARLAVKYQADLVQALAGQAAILVAV